MIEKITLPLIPYKNYRILEGESEFLELHDEYLRSYGCNRIVWSGDSDMIPKERTYDFDYIFFKDNIGSIDRFYCYDDECWKVVIIDNGAHKLEFIMKGKSAASHLIERLLQWKLSKTSPE